MSNKVKQNPLAEELKAHAKTWELPIVENEQTTRPDDYTNALGKPEGWVYEPPEPEPEAPKPLTAEEIEEIRAAAYEDGFNEGKQEGIEKGILEGNEKGYSQGLEQGQEEGLEQGLEQAKGIIDERLDALNKLVEAMHQPLREFDQAAELALVELAGDLARAVIKTELSLNQDILFKTIKEAVSALPLNSAQIEIHLNPDDLAVVQQSYSEEELTKRDWHLMAEPTIERGDCEVKTKTSNISYTMQDRVSEILDRFLQDASSVDSNSA
ncbi:flagellar assembly protein FliH [Catenovulum sp. SM1970]|uniref:flagellar assembly protein FliH n=1 Tax=Marinifaba aquimaris TaxID=2741323 RepID=UPI0015737D22|nr:flagellar assembly protein FliH [Marinifaba aquimaris]NTS76393.1 flagellar assembly protein FliH [Marinifaba aquimaris]